MTANEWTPEVSLKLSNDKPSLTPRDHQKRAWEALSRDYAAGKQAGFIVIPTGGGKTMIAAWWLLLNHISGGGRVLWLAHRRSLLKQAFQTFRTLGNLASPARKTLDLISVSMDDRTWKHVTSEHDVVFASAQSAVREGNSGFVREFVNASKQGVVVVVDEAHHAAARGYARLLRDLKKQDCKLLGLTATPVRMNDVDEKRLSALFDGHVFYQVSRDELTKVGILAVARPETVQTAINFERDFTADDFKHLAKYGDLAPAVLQQMEKNEPRNRQIVEHYKKKQPIYGPTIVFAVNAQHAQTLATEFKQAEISADYVTYNRKGAQDIIERYQRREGPQVLVNVEMLTEGFDAPHTRTVFIARPTKSEALLTQMVGRALRGKASGGNEEAHLVTFVDTWSQFNVLDTKYVLGEGIDSEPDEIARSESNTVSIPTELIDDVYALLRSNVRGTITGVFECVPHGWYVWEELFEDDAQRRSVLVYENQRAAFESLLAAYPTPQEIPADIDEDLARALVRKYFADVPDPLPRWADVQALLNATRNELEVAHHTFEDKRAFEPSRLAEQVVRTKRAVQQVVQEVWDNNATCRSIYKHDQLAFREDVDREVRKLETPPSPPAPPEIIKAVPTQTPRAWAEGERPYSLSALRDSVLSVKRHFPNGAPLLRDLNWSETPSTRLWGFYRHSDGRITINRILNSPDIPYFVLEFLMFHEMLHADMPLAGHDRDFRERERGYKPSAHAIDDAKKRGIEATTKSAPDFWRVKADQFLDTFSRYYAYKSPSEEMEIG